MIGGLFDYTSYRVLVFSDELSDWIGSCEEEDQRGGTQNKFSKDAIEKLREIENKSRSLSRLMREVEWLSFGDISEDSFMRRVEAIEAGD